MKSPMSKYILALDQGTTSSRAVLFDEQQRMLGMEAREIAQLYPREGWVEHNPMEIYSSQYGVMMELITGMNIAPGDIAAVGIANQRETTILWERDTGQPIYNAIVWQCRRTVDMVDGIIADGMSAYIQEATGLIPDAYFSATKIKWLLDNVEGARQRAERGEILFGTVDTWLIWNLTGGRSFYTDYSNASRTMLYHIHHLDWDDALLDYFGIPRAMLPEVRPSSYVYGTVNILGAEIPIASAAGDQQAALFGQCCFNPGEAKNTYGTGCFLLMNTGSEAVASKNGLVTTMAATLPNAIQYALEGSVFVGGAVIQWLRDEMRFFQDSADTEYYAGKTVDTGGVYFVPAFTGLGAPYWDMHARGCIVGLTRGTKQAHIIRAAEESIAYQTLDLIRAMERDMNAQIASLRVDGGACRDSVLLQFQADIMNGRIQRPEILETTALGAALLAGIAAGVWAGIEDVKARWKCDREFLPQMGEDRREALLKGWQKAIKVARLWADS